MVSPIVGQFPWGGEGSLLSFIFNLIFLLLYLVLILYGQKIQVWIMLREIGGAVGRLKIFRDEAQRVSIAAIKEIGGSKDDPTPRVDQFLEYFTTLPIDLDPAGIVWKIDHVIDVRDQRFKDEVKLMAPTANESQISNLEGALDVTLGLNFIYRMMRHFYILGKKTMSLYIIMQVQMALPLIMREAEAFFGAVKAFAYGQPIGDGAGALVAAKLMYGREKRKIAKDIVVTEVPINGRRALVLKAEGPGANIGKPGDAIKRLIEEGEGNVSMVIMIDAAGKFEGEKTGETAEGVGTAIGGIGVDQFKIEETLLKYKIPINSVIIKESLQESVSPMRKEVFDAADTAIARLRRLILERTKEGDTVIIAGIGNTVGIGQ